MIFSDLEGNYLGSDMIPFCAPIKKANLVTPGEDVKGDGIILYMGVEPTATKSDEYGSDDSITPSVCKGNRIIKVKLEKKEEEEKVEEIDDNVN